MHKIGVAIDKTECHAPIAAVTIMRATLSGERYLDVQRYLPLLSNDLMSSWSPRKETNRVVCRSWKMKRNARLLRHSKLISQFSNAQTAVDVRLAEAFYQPTERQQALELFGTWQFPQPA